MGINVGSFVITNGKANATITEASVEIKKAVKRPGRPSKDNKKEQIVVQNSSKPINKSSAYLVDMLTKD
jgi:hypothetical protein